MRFSFLRVNSKSNDWCSYQRQKRRRHRCTRRAREGRGRDRSYVAQAKDIQDCRQPQEARRGREWILLQGLQREPTLQTT